MTVFTFMHTKVALADVIAFSSVLIAAGALLVSIMALRASNRQAREDRDRSERLKAVVFAPRELRPPTGFGFKAINGPGEVTVTDAWLRITYQTQSGILHGERHNLMIGQYYFALLGFMGPRMPFHLPPNDEAVWRMSPATVDIRLNHRSKDPGVLQCLQFQFSVTASTIKTPSRVITIGSHHPRPIPILGHNTTTHYDMALDSDAQLNRLPKEFREWLQTIMNPPEPE
jgi:hypothetical protein